jgi:hypothetical protein
MISILVGALLFVGSPYALSSHAAPAVHAEADLFAQVAALSASDAAPDDLLGAAVAVSGDTVVVGAPGRGAAYVFTKPDGAWEGQRIEDAVLIASQLSAEEEFGWTVAMSGDTVLVSADSATDHSAYVFVKPETGWRGVLTESARLARSDGSKLFPLGRWLAISGGTVTMAGLLSDAAGKQAPPTAYVFVKPAGGWSGMVAEAAKLTPARPSEHTWFTAVDIASDVVVAGAYLDEVEPQQRYGSAYVFVKPDAGWAGVVNERARLIASSASKGEYPFGASVAIDCQTIVVGADFDMINEYGRGTAYVFRRPVTGWSGLLTADARVEPAGDKRAEQALDPRQRDVRSFGFALAVADDTIVAGSWKAAYVFVEPLGGWTGVQSENQKLSAPAGVAATPVDILALSADTLVIGAPSEDLGRFVRQGVGTNTPGSPGSAYVYVRQSSD